MRKFDVRICSCGRIHFVLNSEIESALELNKEVWLVCGGCGKTYRIGADIERDWCDPERINYMMYTVEAENYELTADMFESTDKHKGIFKLIHSSGKRPIMRTGMHATHFVHGCGRFEDSWYPDFWKIERTDITVPEIFQFIEQWRKDRVTVNMNALLNDLTDEEAECLSGYIIEGLNWKGTKFEKEWHK